MSIKKELFGQDSKGREVLAYTIINKNGMSIKVTDIGAALVSVYAPDRNGELADVVLGYDNVASYETGNDVWLGVTVGRSANRIKDAKFTIDGQTYELAKNDGPNNLHCGPDSYAFRKWDSLIIPDDRGEAVRFSILSPDGDQGMPGELKMDVTYVLSNDNEVIIEYTGFSNKKTIINPTNHSYFNLGGHNSGSIVDHKVYIKAARFTPATSESIPTGEYREVAGTPMDFTTAKTIGRDIEMDDEQLKFAGGYDHNFALDNEGRFELVATLEDEKSGRFMEVFTALPGMQLYTGNFLNGKNMGKGGYCYQRREGVCFESQFFPNSVNEPKFVSPVVAANEPFKYITTYRFSTK